MKRATVFLLVFFSAMMISANALAGNALVIDNQTSSGTVGTVTAYFTDGSSEDYDIGGPGRYTFDTGTREVRTIVISDVACSVGETVTVTLSSGGTASHTVRSINDSKKGILSIIR